MYERETRVLLLCEVCQIVRRFFYYAQPREQGCFCAFQPPPRVPRSWHADLPISCHQITPMGRLPSCRIVGISPTKNHIIATDLRLLQRIRLEHPGHDNSPKIKNRPDLSSRKSSLDLFAAITSVARPSPSHFLTLIEGAVKITTTGIILSIPRSQHWLTFPTPVVR